MKAILFDTETTGIIKANWMPQMWEIGGIIVDEKLKVVNDFNYIIKPRQWPLTDDEANVVTKVSGMDLLILGSAPDFSDVLPDLVELMSDCDVMVAHNLAFDREILFNELMIRDAHWRIAWPKFHFCTSEHLEGAYGKREKLGDWHNRLFGSFPMGVHRANQDAEIMRKCMVKDPKLDFDLKSYKGKDFWS